MPKKKEPAMIYESQMEEQLCMQDQLMARVNVC